MYNTSTNYKNTILADSTKHVLKLYIGQRQLEPNHIFDFTMNIEMFSDEIYLGATPMKSCSFKIHKDEIHSGDTEIRVVSGIEGEEIPMGTFVFEDVKEVDFFTYEITAVDYMYKFEGAYDTDLDFSEGVTLLEVLNDLCEKSDVILGSESFINDDTVIAVYDSTLQRKEYLSYIAEQAGGFAIIGRDNKLYIKTFNHTENASELNLNNFKSFKWGQQTSISKIAYEDGIQDFKKGDDSGSTLWIAQKNMYVTSQSQIDNIYDELTETEREIEEEGTSITIEDSKEGTKIDYSIKGETTQSGTPTPSSPVVVNNVTGEQIIGIYKHNFLSLKDNIEWRADNTITKTIIDDNNITISYSGENATYKRLWQDNNLQIPNGHYDISCIATCTDNNVVVGIGIDVYPLGSTTRSDWHEIWFTQNAREQGVRVHNDFEIDNSQYYYRIRFFLSQSTGTTSNSVQFKDIMLKKHGDETEYEIYQGKKYEINLGKNLFESTLGTTTISGVTFTKNDNGTYTANGTASEFIGLEIGRFSFSSAKTITYSGAPSNASMSTYSFNLKKIVGTTETWLQDELGDGKTITAEANTTYSVRLVIRSGVSVSNVVFKPMVEEGYQKTTYVPYFTPIELNKIGDYQDLIRKGTGKNLIEPIMASVTLNGVTCTNNGDGSFTLNGTATASTSFRLDQSTYNGTNNLKTYNGTYTLSCSEIENGLDLRVMQNSTWVSPLKMVNSNTPVTGIIDKNNCFTYINVSNGKSVNNLIIRPMLEKSSSATSYEPYACTGKNLFDKNTQLYKSNSYIDGSGQEGSNTEWSIFKTYLKPNTTYTLTNSGASGTPGYVLYNSSGVRVGGSNYSQRSHITFTTTSDTSYMLESVVANTASNRYDLNIFQIEQSSTATSYEPFVYSTLKDKWYIEKNVLKLVVPDTVTGTMQNSNKRFYVNGANLGSTNILRNTSSSQTYGLYCDILGEVTASRTWGGTQGISYDYNSGQNRGCLDFAISGLTTIAEYQNALKGKAIYAIANTPEYTLIENEELINQLEELDNATLMEGTTNIIVSGALPFVMNLDFDVRNRNFYQFEGGSIVDPANDLGDVVIIDEKPVIFEGKMSYLGKWYIDVNSTALVKDKAHSMNTKTDTKTKIRRVESQINQIEGKITQVVEATEEISQDYVTNSEYTTYKTESTQSMSELSQRVSRTVKTLYGENDDGLVKRVEKTETDISQNAEDITLSVGRISSLETKTEELDDNTQKVVKSFKFNDDGLTISNQGSDEDDGANINIDSEDIKIRIGTATKLLINGSGIYYDSASFNKLDLGEFAIVAEENGFLSIIYEGGN